MLVIRGFKSPLLLCIEHRNLTADELGDGEARRLLAVKNGVDDVGRKSRNRYGG